MLVKLAFWLTWLFIFFPVLAWVLGFILPAKSKDGSATGKDGGVTDSKTDATDTAKSTGVDSTHQPTANPTS